MTSPDDYGRPRVLPPAPSIASPARDPIALAGMTVKAVDQIGETAAGEIERAAQALQDGAFEIAEKMRELATAMREHSRIAGERVDQFCKQSTDVVSTIRGLQQRLDGINATNGSGGEASRG